MKKRKHLWALFAAGVAGLTAPSCDNTNIAVPGEPEGAIQVTRVTLLTDGDTELRETQVFSDTSAPAACLEGQECIFTTTRDLYGSRLSPINPDSYSQIRVIFNKIPLKVGEKDLETPVFPLKAGQPDGGEQDTTLPPVRITLNVTDAAALSSPDGCGSPAMTMSVSLAGTDKTPNPIDIPYGPALQLVPTAHDALRALEPGCKYEVKLNDALAGRDGKPWDKATAKFLSFTTEALRVLRSGIGDEDGDTWYPATPKEEEKTILSQPSPPILDGGKVANDGAIRVKLSAALHDSSVETAGITATVNGVGTAVKATVYQVGTDDNMKPVCDAGNGRALFIYPASGTWAAMPKADDKIVITIDGAKIWSAAQTANIPKDRGKSSLSGTITVNATSTGAAAPAEGYMGILTADLAQSTDVVCKPAPTEDMTSPADMTSPKG